MNYEKVICVGDFHVPFQDEKCLSSFLQFCQWWEPETIFINGDLVDFYAISRFSKDPERELKLQEELDEAINVLEQIRKTSPTARMCLLRGNHERRLKMYLWNQAKPLSGLRDLTVESLLHLKNLGIEYEENGRLIHKGILIKHGSLVRKFSCYSAKAEQEKSGMSGVSGHTHRGGVYYVSNDGGDYAWMESGCMCRSDQEYMEGEKPNWMKGWGTALINKKTNRFLFNFIPYVDGKAMYQGKEF